MMIGVGELIIIGFILGFIGGILKDRRFETAVLYGIGGAIILPIVFYIISFLLTFIIIVIAIIIILAVIGYFIGCFT